MEQFINSLVESSQLPFVTAFLLGLLISVNPCTFTTNVMVLGFMAKDVEGGGKRMFLKGIAYTVGRIVSYTVLGLVCIPILRKGASTFHIQSWMAEFGGYILSPTLIIFGLFLLFGDKLPFKFGFRATEKDKERKGIVGAFVLGLLFALAFCPVSGIIYFGMILPMAVSSTAMGIMYLILFSVASGILVLLLAGVIAYGISSLGKFYNRVQIFQKWLNRIVAIAFLLAGVYYFYLYYL